MSKTKIIRELTSLLAIGLRHRIGSMVNENEVYAKKYAKDAEVLLEQARKTVLKENWNLYDKNKIFEELKNKLRVELASRDFLNEKKFDIMDGEIRVILKKFGLME